MNLFRVLWAVQFTKENLIWLAAVMTADTIGIVGSGVFGGTTKRSTSWRD